MIEPASKLPLIVIVGPTASGKSALAVELAGKFSGEVICADSRTIYKGMDIGTAKPSSEDRSKVPHWGLDLVEPGERFTVADFKAYSDTKIAEIRQRGKVPFLVGGSGLYVDAVIFDYKFAPTDLKLRQELEQLSVSELIERCRKDNILIPENNKNIRYLVRAIERGSQPQQIQKSIMENTIVVGIATDKHELYERIQKRSEQIFADGMIEEALALGQKYGWSSEAMTGNAYPLVKRYSDGEITKSELYDLFARSDRKLAKKQITFMKRNKNIKWLQLDEAANYLTNILSSVLK